MSPEFKSVVEKLVKTHVMPDRSELSDMEKEYLDLMIIAAGFSRKEEFKAAHLEKTKEKVKSAAKLSQTSSRARKALERLKVLVGSVAAGNHHNPDIFSEGSKLVALLVKAGELSAEDGHLLLSQLK
jgi:hypothetical protein